MSLIRSRSVRGATLALATALLATACAEGASDPMGLSMASPLTADAITTETTVGSPVLDDPTEWFRRIWVCKVGTNADFAVSVNGAAPTAVSLLNGQCKVVHYMESTDINQIDTVTVTEVASALTVLDSIVVDSTHNLLKFRLPTITGTNEARTYTFRSKGAIATFYNHVAPPPPPPPPTEAGEGCTPGYWKQRHHFANWTLPYTPGTKFKNVFANAFGNKTLYQVLNARGGGLNALGRHTVAALLNAASSGVDYDLTVAQVIEQFNAAYASGDYEAQKDVFADLNEQGCPLGRPSNDNDGDDHDDHDDGDDCEDEDRDHGGHHGHLHRSVWELKDCDRDGHNDHGNGNGSSWGWGWGRGRP